MQENDYIPSNITIVNESIEIAESMNSELSEAKKRKTYTRAKMVDTEGGGHIISRIADKYNMHMKFIEKKQTVSIGKIIEMNNKKKMPVMLKHCVVAVRPKLRSQGSLQAFIGAHNICFWSFRRHGLINSRTFSMTGRGSLREKLHRSGKDPERNGLKGSSKTALYNKLYNSAFRWALKYQ